MTQDMARKAAVRAHMAETGESCTEVARQLANMNGPPGSLAVSMSQVSISITRRSAAAIPRPARPGRTPGLLRSAYLNTPLPGL
jgi:hypothetical protein